MITPVNKAIFSWAIFIVFVIEHDFPPHSYCATHALHNTHSTAPFYLVLPAPHDCQKSAFCAHWLFSSGCFLFQGFGSNSLFFFIFLQTCLPCLFCLWMVGLYKLYKPSALLVHVTKLQPLLELEEHMKLSYPEPDSGASSPECTLIRSSCPGFDTGFCPTLSGDAMN